MKAFFFEEIGFSNNLNFKPRSRIQLVQASPDTKRTTLLYMALKCQDIRRLNLTVDRTFHRTE